MKITELNLVNFKRFTDLQIKNIPTEAKLVLLIGANGSGKSSIFDAFYWFVKNESEQQKNGQKRAGRISRSKQQEADIDLQGITENWIPANCQLWTASHSLGFIEYAKDTDHSVILDFDNFDFDDTQILEPLPKNQDDLLKWAKERLK